MISRRTFLTASATIAIPVISTAEMPPALAALKNRRAEAQPITLAEREGRLERAQALLVRHQLNAVALAGGTSLEYFTGICWGNSERLFLFVLPRGGKPFYVCPAFEEERVRERMTQTPLGKESRIYTWDEDVDPYSLVLRGLGEAGITGGQLGLDERMPFVFSNSIAAAARGVKCVSATPVTAGCRGVKTAAELKLMQLANDVTLQVYEAAWLSLKPGMTNREFTALIDAGYQKTGFSGEASCQVDEYSALPHGSAQPQTIREGSVVLIDDGCIVEGYQSDISRTFVVGKATDKMKRVFDAVHKAQSAALQAARPGVACGAVDGAARGVVDAAGFGPGYLHFSHRVGHGIGMDMHEWPYLVKGNMQKLETGMTFSDEPGIYLRGEFGVRLEDDMHVTPDGARWFTPQSNSIEQPFSR